MAHHVSFCSGWGLLFQGAAHVQSNPQSHLHYCMTVSVKYAARLLCCWTRFSLFKRFCCGHVCALRITKRRYFHSIALFPLGTYLSFPRLTLTSPHHPLPSLTNPKLKGSWWNPKHEVVIGLSNRSLDFSLEDLHSWPTGHCLTCLQNETSLTNSGLVFHFWSLLEIKSPCLLHWSPFQ